MKYWTVFKFIKGGRMKNFDPIKEEGKFWKLCISAMVISVVAYIGLMILLAIYS
jgi:hypothetical protein